MSQPPAEAQAFWVVIPAYNEGATIRDVATRAQRYCTNVIVVDDGSTDETPERLAGLDITVLRNNQNRGKADSLWSGFQEALSHGAAAIITLDADGQHAPEEIPKFIAAALRDPEAFLIGTRRVEQRKAFRGRYAANRVADFWISWAAGRPIEDSQSGFRLYPARFLRNLKVKHGLKQSFVFESEVLIETGRRGAQCLHIPVSVTPRTGPRTSHFRPVLDIARITRMVAWKILQRGLYLRGLLASRRSSPVNLLETTGAEVVRQIHQRTLS
jgi:glycosyltransferase involved in cell wall biosynthesis